MEGKRRNIRYAPDPLDVAYIQLSSEATSPFKPDIVGLIVDEAAMSGASVVVRGHQTLQPKSICRVKLGRLEALRAEVVWTKPLDGELLRIGLRLLE